MESSTTEARRHSGHTERGFAGALRGPAGLPARISALFPDSLQEIAVSTPGMSSRDSRAIPEELNELSGEVVTAAIEVHKELGPGLLERAYNEALALELEDRGLDVAQEVEIPVRYDGQDLGAAYRIDLLVDGSLIVEAKALAQVEDVHRAQLLTYLTFAEKRLGLLFNFHVPKLVDGIHRLALCSPRTPPLEHSDPL